MYDTLVTDVAFSLPTWAIAETTGAAVDERWWRFMGRLHPLVVHFPIGLALAAAAVEFINILRRRADASPFGLTATGIAAVAAAFASWFGWLNADFENATADNTLFLHRWLGIIAAGGLMVVWFTGLAGRSGDRRTALNGYRWGLILCAVVVAVGSHFGGEMVYGKGYLTKVLVQPSDKAILVDADPAEAEHVAVPDQEPAESTVAAAVTPVSFQKDVLPIFEAHCIECHGPDKVKGSLRMDTIGHLFEGDPEWWTVVPGEPDDSLVVTRMELPADDPDAMPPKGDRVDPADIALIRRWIVEGADGAGAGVAAFDIGSPSTADDSTDATVTEPAVDEAANDAAAAAAAAALVEAAVLSLREREALVMPVAQGSDDWEINASLVNPPFADEDMSRLDGLQPLLVWANFARSGVTDDGIGILAEFPRLTRVRLDNTSVGDGGVDTLLGLPALEMVNLYGTRLTDAGLVRLAAHPGLRRIYCAGTEVTAEGLAAAARDGLEIVGPILASDGATADAEAGDEEGAAEPESP